MIWLAKALGVARWGRVLSLLTVVAVATAAGGWWAGAEWEAGRAAQRDLAEERRILAAAQDQVELMQGIAARLEADHEQHRAWNRAQQHQLQEFVAANPDLAHCHIGPDGLRLWVGWHQAATGAGDPGESDGGLPDPPGSAIGGAARPHGKPP